MSEVILSMGSKIGYTTEYVENLCAQAQAEIDDLKTRAEEAETEARELAAEVTRLRTEVVAADAATPPCDRGCVAAGVADQECSRHGLSPRALHDELLGVHAALSEAVARAEGAEEALADVLTERNEARAARDRWEDRAGEVAWKLIEVRQAAALMVHATAKNPVTGLGYPDYVERGCGEKILGIVGKEPSFSLGQTPDDRTPGTRSTPAASGDPDPGPSPIPDTPAPEAPAAQSPTSPPGILGRSGALSGTTTLGPSAPSTAETMTTQACAEDSARIGQVCSTCGGDGGMWVDGAFRFCACLFVGVPGSTACVAIQQACSECGKPARFADVDDASPLCGDCSTPACPDCAGAGGEWNLRSQWEECAACDGTGDAPPGRLSDPGPLAESSLRSAARTLQALAAQEYQTSHQVTDLDRAHHIVCERLVSLLDAGSDQ